MTTNKVGTSIVEVARVAGVSKSTVSRVINQSAQVAPQIVEAVRKAMKEIGYEPPLRRRGPKPLGRKGIRTGNIALLVMGRMAADLYRMPVFPSLLHGIERGLAEQGLNLVLSNLGEREGVPTVLAGNQIDGVLLFGKWDSMPAAIRARLLQVPAVWVMREHSDEERNFDHVFYDNAAVGKLAARYLLKSGHRQVAYLNIEPLHSAFAQRQRDFVSHIESAGGRVHIILPPPDDTEPEISVSQTLVERMLQSSPKLSALFVPSDAQLPNLYHALMMQGVKVGTDIDVIGCNNDEQFLSRLSPRPATIDINLELVGRRGVQRLLWRMRNSEQRSRISVLVEPVLVEPGASNGEG